MTSSSGLRLARPVAQEGQIAAASAGASYKHSACGKRFSKQEKPTIADNAPRPANASKPNIAIAGAHADRSRYSLQPKREGLEEDNAESICQSAHLYQPNAAKKGAKSQRQETNKVIRGRMAPTGNLPAIDRP